MALGKYFAIIISMLKSHLYSKGKKTLEISDISFYTLNKYEIKKNCISTSSIYFFYDGYFCVKIIKIV